MEKHIISQEIYNVVTFGFDGTLMNNSLIILDLGLKDNDVLDAYEIRYDLLENGNLVV